MQHGGHGVRRGQEDGGNAAHQAERDIHQRDRRTPQAAERGGQQQHDEHAHGTAQQVQALPGLLPALDGAVVIHGAAQLVHGGVKLLAAGGGQVAQVGIRRGVAGNHGLAASVVAQDEVGLLRAVDLGALAERHGFAAARQQGQAPHIIHAHAQLWLQAQHDVPVVQVADDLPALRPCSAADTCSAASATERP